MTLIAFLVTLVVLGIVFYLIENFIPMSPPFKSVLRIVGVVVVLFLVLALFGIVNAPFTLR